jgi:hypothetical protein
MDYPRRRRASSFDGADWRATEGEEPYMSSLTPAYFSLRQLAAEPSLSLPLAYGIECYAPKIALW